MNDILVHAGWECDPDNNDEDDFWVRIYYGRDQGTEVAIYLDKYTGAYTLNNLGLDPLQVLQALALLTGSPQEAIEILKAKRTL